MRSIGIFGGTFDPVHFGHLRAALESREQLDVDEFRLLPAGQPPHRDTPGVSSEHRLEMVRIALAGQPGFSVDDREVQRAGPSWMVDTLSAIRAEESEVSLILVIGQDAANELDTWHRWRDLFELAHIAIMRRPDSHALYSATLAEEIEARQLPPGKTLNESKAGYVVPVQITQLDISSTAVRKMLARAESPAFLVPDAVIEYIRRHGLYASGNEPRTGR